MLIDKVIKEHVVFSLIFLMRSFMYLVVEQMIFLQKLARAEK